MRALFGLFVSVLTALAWGQDTFSFRVTEDWGSGFQGEITINHPSGSTINDWRLEFDFDRQFSSIWNASLVSRVGIRTTVCAAAWNGMLLPGSQVTFGFVGSPGNVTNQPTNYRLSGGSGGGGGGGATGAPSVPSLSMRSNADGSITAEWNLWQGNNGTSWELLEDGQTVHTGSLTDGTPSPQNGSVTLPGRDYSAHSYQVALSNSFGRTASTSVPLATGGASKIVVSPADGLRQAFQTDLRVGVTSRHDLATLGVTSPQFVVATNYPAILDIVLSGKVLKITPRKEGRASLLIRETTTGETRNLGLRVANSAGRLPGLPPMAIGSVSEDTPGDLAFWRDFENPLRNKRMDVRYIYLNGGPYNGWRTWSARDGFRLVSFIRESQKLGMVPYFVWYNIPDGGESYWTDLQHIQTPTYMRDYFLDLKFALELIRANAPDDPVGLVLEPDFLGYMMQNSGVRPGQISAVTSAAYTSGVLSAATDPVFANNVSGLVRAINYTISKYAPNATFGWQFNLWASPGIHVGIPARGLMHLTDTIGIVNGRAAIAGEAREIARYYAEAGITTYGAKFVSIDKYGLDAGAEVGAALNPAGSTWFWNLDHWNNYLLFASILKAETALPVVLWQLPVGRINSTQTVSPYTGAIFPDMPNVTTRFEDSATTFFFGDKFRANGARKTHFIENWGGDPTLRVTGDIVEWGSHKKAAAQAGVTMMLFGAGVGDSTDGVGSPPTDDYWWITKSQAAFPSR
ncbi:MAG: cellulose binding domain-containing protein [Fimbriimonadaceae bacterium]|nr:cellulose binding domain-containing protein [Fimbriimonadaceae bacterium]